MTAAAPSGSWIEIGPHGARMHVEGRPTGEQLETLLYARASAWYVLPERRAAPVRASFAEWAALIRAQIGQSPRRDAVLAAIDAFA